MNNEIKEILDRIETASEIFDCLLKPEECSELLDYITNLQQENERLKRALNCKEYFSATMPEDTEFVILTKNNYDRQQKDIQLELIDYKLRVEKAIEYIDKQKKKMYKSRNKIAMFILIKLENILQGENNATNKDL